MKRFLREVLGQWLENDPQLDLLVEALIEIGNRRLAEKLETAYDGRFPEKLCVCVTVHHRLNGVIKQQSLGVLSCVVCLFLDQDLYDCCIVEHCLSVVWRYC